MISGNVPCPNRSGKKYRKCCAQETSDIHGVARETEWDTVIRTVCSPNCTNSCGINAFIRNGRLVKVEPADFPDERYRRICLKGMAFIQRAYGPDRLKYPMKRVSDRGAGEFARISWEEALDIITEKFTEISKKYGPEAIAWQTMTGNYGVLTDAPGGLMSLIGGTISSISGLMGDHGCDIGTRVTTGISLPGSDITDMMNSKLVILWPSNIAETTLNDMHFMYDAKEAGIRFVSIDPRFTPTAAAADWWIPIRPGTDSALALGMMNIMLREGIWDKDFMREYTIGPLLVRADNGKLLRQSDISPDGACHRYVVWDETKDYIGFSDEQSIKPALFGSYTINSIEVSTAFQLLSDAIREYTPERVEAITGVADNDVIQLAREYANTKPAQIRGSQGMNRTYHGHQPYRTIITLCAMHGSIGIPGGGYSHSGGWGSLIPVMTGTGPLRQPDPSRCAKELKGMHLYPAITDGKPWPIKALWITKYNMITQAPAQTKLTKEVLPKLDFILISEQVMNDTAKWADVLLPVTSHFEETDLVGAWSNFYVQLRQQVIEPMWECKSNLEATSLIAERLGLGQYYQKNVNEWLTEILAQNPSLQGITLDALRKGPVRMKVPEPWVAFADRKFPTATGRIEFYTEDWKQFGQELPIYVEPLEGHDSPKSSKYPLSFISSHSRFSANSTHANLPWIKEISPEPLLEINPIDAEARGIRDGDRVIVFNDRGRCTLKAKLTEGIMPSVVNICQKWWARHFEQGHYGELTHYTLNPLQDYDSETNYAPFDILVEVKKAPVR